MELSQRRERLVGRLKTRKSRVKERRVLVEGVRAVSEALEADAELSFAVVSARLESVRGGAELADRLAASDVLSVPDDQLDALADTERPQGVLAIFEQPEVGVADIPVHGRVLLLDGVQDPGNVGTLVRSASAFGLDAVICLEGTVDPWSPKSVRGSAGMVFRLPVIMCGAAEAVSALKERKVPVLIASGEGTPVQPADRDGGFALVVGNEGVGVRDEFRGVADETISVPMEGNAESLNVGIAGSILMHALTRRGA